MASPEQSGVGDLGPENQDVDQLHSKTINELRSVQDEMIDVLEPKEEQAPLSPWTYLERRRKRISRQIAEGTLKESGVW